MLVRSSLLLVAGALAAAPAFAGGFAPVVAPAAPAVPVAVAPAAPASDWTGFYAGGQLGQGDVALEYDDGSDVIDAADGSGALYGVHAGYMRDFGRLVVGAELDWDAASIGLEAGNGFLAEGFEVATVDSIARAKLRLGFDAGRFLPYVTAGVARASIDVVDNFADADDTLDGRFVGLGVAYAVNDRLTVGLEALRHDFGGPEIDGLDFDTTVDTISLRASWRF